MANIKKKFAINIGVLLRLWGNDNESVCGRIRQEKTGVRASKLGKTIETSQPIITNFSMGEISLLCDISVPNQWTLALWHVNLFSWKNSLPSENPKQPCDFYSILSSYAKPLPPKNGQYHVKAQTERSRTFSHCQVTHLSQQLIFSNTWLDITHVQNSFEQSHPSGIRKTWGLATAAEKCQTRSSSLWAKANFLFAYTTYIRVWSAGTTSTATHLWLRKYASVPS